MRLKDVKFFVLGLSAAIMVGLVSCDDDGVDIPNVPLEGLIDGEEWASEFGNVYGYSAGTIPKYTYRLLSTTEIGTDPCPIVSTTKPHIRMVLPLGTGSYSIPLADFNETVKFDYGDGRVFSATSGFIELFGGNQNQLVGYIQAVLDEDNIVEGRFVVEIC